MMPVKDDLTKEQIDMLALSDDDIKNGRLITQSELDEKDKEFFDFNSNESEQL